MSVFERPDRSGRMSREKYLIDNYPSHHAHVVAWAEGNGLSGLPFRERLYLCTHRMGLPPACANCGAAVEFVSMSRGYRQYCGSGCVSSSEAVKAKRAARSMETWGTKSPSMSKAVKDRMVATNLERYGSRSPMGNDEIRGKATSTLMSNHGVTNPAKSADLLAKRVGSFKKGAFKESFYRTSMSRYGVDHPWRDASIHAKTVESGKAKRLARSKETIHSKLAGHPGYGLISVDNRNNTLVGSCPRGHTFSSTRFTFDDRCAAGNEVCTVCKPLNSGTSGLEAQFKDFLVSLGVEFTPNTRVVIPPQEIDAYVPSRRVAFEFNGLYWHSTANKTPDYHLAKWRRCDEAGIRLFTVWEDDWLYRNHIVRSNVRHALGMTGRRVHARECMVAEVPASDAARFLVGNHLQGDCRSPVRVGLYLHGELVSIMTFSRQRLPLSSGRPDGQRWELTRFCSLVGVSVVGAASRLLASFVRTHRPAAIETFSDNSNFAGGLYEALGFEFSHLTRPGYWYLVGGIRQHRFGWRKSVLVKRGADPSKTEEQIMSELGHPRIYNAGNRKWVKVVG